MKSVANHPQTLYYIPVITKRNLSISTCFDYAVPIETQIPLIAKAGFTYVSPGGSRKHFDVFSKEARQKLLKLLDKYGLKIDTLHGPIPCAIDSKEMKQLAAAAVELKASVVILHCSPFEIPESELALRLPQLKIDCRELNKIYEETGVAFALENMAPGPATELVRQTLFETDYPGIGFCYDSSHDQIDGPRPFTLLKELKDKLIAIHLSDRIKPFSDHVPPWEGFIHWDELCPILRRCNIEFPLLFEVTTMFSAEKDPVQFLKLAYQRGCMVWDKVMG
jgi:sugar phosphate isomerase/epimerase